MTVEVLNNTKFDGHSAEIDAVVAIAKQNGWEKALGQSASLENLVKAPEQGATGSLEAAPDITPE